jgi:hypothetical protein
MLVLLVAAVVVLVELEETHLVGLVVMVAQEHLVLLLG